MDRTVGLLRRLGGHLLLFAGVLVAGGSVLVLAENGLNGLWLLVGASLLYGLLCVVTGISLIRRADP